MDDIKKISQSKVWEFYSSHTSVDTTILNMSWREGDWIWIKNIEAYETNARNTIQSRREPNDSNNHSSVEDFASVAYL